MAGYSATPLVKKLGIKEGSRVALVNSPKGFQKELDPLPAKAKQMRMTISDSLLLVLSTNGGTM
ncbi:MAG: hypothetical protein ACREBC_28730 [Pyrinomonadaceae bacterium]